MSLELSSPEPLGAAHILDGFACGEPVLDDWLKRRALANQVSGASRTFVVADADRRVVGYYALAAGGVRRNMPNPIPVLVLGRLAIDQRAQGAKLGAALLKDAVRRAAAVAHNAGVRALLVHAINEHARRFYLHYGFQPSPQHSLTLMLRLNSASA